MKNILELFLKKHVKMLNFAQSKVKRMLIKQHGSHIFRMLSDTIYENEKFSLKTLTYQTGPFYLNIRVLVGILSKLFESYSMTQTIH